MPRHRERKTSRGADGDTIRQAVAASTIWEQYLSEMWSRSEVFCKIRVPQFFQINIHVTQAFEVGMEERA